MFQDITNSNTLTGASFEILIMLVWAFVLWFFCAWLVKPSKHYTKKIVTPAEASYVMKKTQKAVVVPTPAKTPESSDDFKLIEWIGPRIENHLHKHGVISFQDIVKEDVEGLEVILLEWWPRLSMHSPVTWWDQAKLASEKKWKELEEYQEILNAGRKK